MATTASPMSPRRSLTSSSSLSVSSSKSSKPSKQSSSRKSSITSQQTLPIRRTSVPTPAPATPTPTPPPVVQQAPRPRIMRPPFVIPREVHLKYLQLTLDLARRSPPRPTNFRVGCVIVSYTMSAKSSLAKPVVDDHILSVGYTLELPGNTHAEQCALAKLLPHQPLSAVQTWSTCDDCTIALPTSMNLPPQIAAERARLPVPEDPLHPHNPVSTKASASSNPNAEDLSSLSHILPQNAYTILYTSLEPCGHRLSGAVPCVERILATRQPNGLGGIRKVVFGAKEPGTFVQESHTCKILHDAGIEWQYFPDLEPTILEVATAGHTKEGGGDRGFAPTVEEPQAMTPPEPAAVTETTMTETNIDNITGEERKRQEDMPRNPMKRMMEAPKTSP